MDGGERYRRAGEIIRILRQAWSQERIQFEGEFYKLDLPAAPVKPYQENGGPLLYFGGISPPAQALCAEYCDVILMWPETEDRLIDTMRNMTTLAAEHDRVIDFGLRIHVIVRETELEARAAADRLVSKLDSATGEALKHRPQDGRFHIRRLRRHRENEQDNQESRIHGELPGDGLLLSPFRTVRKTPNFSQIFIFTINNIYDRIYQAGFQPESDGMP